MDTKPDTKPSATNGNKKKEEAKVEGLTKSKKNGESSSEDESSEEQLHIVKPPTKDEPISNNLKRKREPENDEANKKRKLDGGEEGTKVRVGNLSFALDGKEDDMREQFKSCGTIKSVEFIKNDKGWFSGAAILEFETADEANKALELHDQEFFDRLMNVTIYHVRGSKSKSDSWNFTPSAKPEGCNTVWIGNLSYSIDENEVWEFFSDCGTVVDVRWPKNVEDFPGYGWVEFSDGSATDLAVAKNGNMIAGRNIKIDFATPSNRGAAKPFNRGRRF